MASVIGEVSETPRGLLTSDATPFFLCFLISKMGLSVSALNSRHFTTSCPFHFYFWRYWHASSDQAEFDGEVSVSFKLGEAALCVPISSYLVIEEAAREVSITSSPLCC